MKKRNRAHGKVKDASEVAEQLDAKGIDPTAFKERIKTQKRTEKLSVLVKRKHAHLESDEDAMMDETEEGAKRAERNFENRKRS